MTNLYRLTSLVLLLACFSVQAAEPNINLKSTYIRTVYPGDTNTVLDAAVYLISHTNYRISVGYPAPKDAFSIINESLPPISKDVKTLSIADALLTLVDSSTYLIIDRENGLISFTREP